ncbi:MAG: hypothetical protein IPJ38_03570 [Dechloromonas sp.]|uniref:Uncharacterized protein n=1 Tax=Candidatus Dechloromonas phosphorivorans TaxID=2899244 RepID=A0A935JV54_9RHOO|nr:hypothetical protein [Candidatus Dechloromonas phosphorivorans]
MLSMLSSSANGAKPERNLLLSVLFESAALLAGSSATNEKLEQIGYLIVHLGDLGFAINNDIQYATHVRVNGGCIAHD